MTLPPVVSDAERCQVASDEHGWLPQPHVWKEKAVLGDLLGELVVVCRFCGGRKP